LKNGNDKRQRELNERIQHCSIRTRQPNAVFIIGQQIHIKKKKRLNEKKGVLNEFKRGRN